MRYFRPHSGSCLLKEMLLCRNETDLSFTYTIDRACCISKPSVTVLAREASPADTALAAACEMLGSSRDGGGGISVRARRRSKCSGRKGASQLRYSADNALHTPGVRYAGSLQK